MTEKRAPDGTEYDGLEDADHGCFVSHDKTDAKLVAHSNDPAVESPTQLDTGP